MKQLKKHLTVITALALIISLFAGCAGAKRAESSGTVATASTGSSASYGDGVIGGSGSGTGVFYAARDSAESGAVAMESAPAVGSSGSSGGAMTKPGSDSASEPAVIDPVMPPIDGPVVEPPPGHDKTPQAGLLTAARWSDNDNFDFFRDVLGREEWTSLQRLWGIVPTSRCSVHVVNERTQEPVKGALVELLRGSEAISSAVTDHNGNAYLYYDLTGSGQYEPTGLRATYGKVTLLQDSSSVAEHTELSLDISDADVPEGKVLDLMFMVDTTGSMGDELEFLKEELSDVIRRVRSANEGIRIRLSVNFYRDEGDEYVVKYFAFTEDVDTAVSNIKAQYSAGGGDYPEAVDTALENAVTGHDWLEDSVKLMFFVLDAPPHSDRDGTPERIRENIEKSAQLGIRIMPIVSSGTDTETEFIMRSAAAVTGGTYVFLTDDSGIGYSHLVPTIGQYTVEPLNTLLIDLINEYCK